MRRDQKDVAQGAADAAVVNFEEGLVSLPEIGATVAHAVGVDVHFRHVVDGHRDTAVLAIVEHAIQEGSLSGAEKAREDGDGRRISVWIMAIPGCYVIL